MDPIWNDVPNREVQQHTTRDASSYLHSKRSKQGHQTAQFDSSSSLPIAPRWRGLRGRGRMRLWRPLNICRFHTGHIQRNEVVPACTHQSSDVRRCNNSSMRMLVWSCVRVSNGRIQIGILFLVFLRPPIDIDGEIR